MLYRVFPRLYFHYQHQNIASSHLGQPSHSLTILNITVARKGSIAGLLDDVNLDEVIGSNWKEELVIGILTISVDAHYFSWPSWQELVR